MSAEADEHAGGDPDSQLDEARDVLQEARRRLTEVPAEVVVANHIMGLYELAAIHLGAMPPDLKQSALAIDAVACLVEGLGDRIGPDAATMRDALANIRLAFVQIKSSLVTETPPATEAPAAREAPAATEAPAAPSTGSAAPDDADGG